MINKLKGFHVNNSFYNPLNHYEKRKDHIQLISLKNESFLKNVMFDCIYNSKEERKNPHLKSYTSLVPLPKIKSLSQNSMNQENSQSKKLLKSGSALNYVYIKYNKTPKDLSYINPYLYRECKVSPHKLIDSIRTMIMPKDVFGIKIYDFVTSEVSNRLKLKSNNEKISQKIDKEYLGCKITMQVLVLKKIINNVITHCVELRTKSNKVLTMVELKDCFDLELNRMRVKLEKDFTQVKKMSSETSVSETSEKTKFSHVLERIKINNKVKKEIVSIEEIEKSSLDQSQLPRILESLRTVDNYVPEEEPWLKPVLNKKPFYQTGFEGDEDLETKENLPQDLQSAIKRNLLHEIFNEYSDVKITPYNNEEEIKKLLKKYNRDEKRRLREIKRQNQVHKRNIINKRNYSERKEKKENNSSSKGDRPYSQHHSKEISSSLPDTQRSLLRKSKRRKKKKNKKSISMFSKRSKNSSDDRSGNGNNKMTQTQNFEDKSEEEDSEEEDSEEEDNEEEDSEEEDNEEESNEERSKEESEEDLNDDEETDKEQERSKKDLKENEDSQEISEGEIEEKNKRENPKSRCSSDKQRIKAKYKKKSSRNKDADLSGSRKGKSSKRKSKDSSQYKKSSNRQREKRDVIEQSEGELETQKKEETSKRKEIIDDKVYQEPESKPMPNMQTNTQPKPLKEESSEKVEKLPIQPEKIELSKEILSNEINSDINQGKTNFEDNTFNSNPAPIERGLEISLVQGKPESLNGTDIEVRKENYKNQKSVGGSNENNRHHRKKKKLPVINTTKIKRTKDAKEKGHKEDQKLQQEPLKGEKIMTNKEVVKEVSRNTVKESTKEKIEENDKAAIKALLKEISFSEKPKSLSSNRTSSVLKVSPRQGKTNRSSPEMRNKKKFCKTQAKVFDLHEKFILPDKLDAKALSKHLRTYSGRHLPSIIRKIKMFHKMMEKASTNRKIISLLALFKNKDYNLNKNYLLDLIYDAEEEGDELQEEESLLHINDTQNDGNTSRRKFVRVGGFKKKNFSRDIFEKKVGPRSNYFQEILKQQRDSSYIENKKLKKSLIVKRDIREKSQESNYNSTSLSKFIEAISALKEQNPNEYLKKITDFFDEHMNNSDFALRRRMEDRLNEFKASMKNRIEQRMKLRNFYKNRIFFKEPCVFGLKKGEVNI